MHDCLFIAGAVFFCFLFWILVIEWCSSIGVANGWDCASLFIEYI